MASDRSSSSVIGAAMPDQLIAPALRRQLQQCYERGKSLVSDDKYDFDYAHTMFAECVVRDPSNLVYLDAFLDNLSRKYNNNKRGARFSGFGGNRSAFKKAHAKKEWTTVLELGPDLLKTNPWDIPTLRAMAEACEAVHYNEVELRYLKNALEANPKDLDVNRHCARSLARMGQFDQAMACWHRVEELRPSDAEAPKMIAELTVEKHRFHAGVPDQRPATGRAAGASRPAGGAQQSAGAARPGTELGGSGPPRSSDGDAPRSAPPKPGARPGAGTDADDDFTPPSFAPSAPTKRREIQLTPRQRLERAIVDFPAEISNYVDLSQLHMDEGRYVEAEQVLTRALAASGQDPKIREQLDDAQIRRVQHQLAIAEKRAAAKNTEEATNLVGDIRASLHRLELDVYTRRSQHSPRDLGLKFEVALRLKRLANYIEAARQFQEARADPAHRALATIEMGECLQHAKQYAKALQCYQKGAELAQSDNRMELRKAALYRAGVLAAALAQAEVARGHFQAVIELDPGYKDVRTRLDKLDDISDKE